MSLSMLEIQIIHAGVAFAEQAKACNNSGYLLVDILHSVHTQRQPKPDPVEQLNMARFT